MKLVKLSALLSVILVTTGCAGLVQPKDPDNICSMFKERPTWRTELQDSQRKWGIPMSVTAAIIYQESSFKHDARPGSKATLFGMRVGRKSSAYGYAQALDATWEDYKKATGNWRSRRDNFGDAVDFMSWFNAQTVDMNHVSKYNARDLYYNYHEGWGGYRSKTYLKKPFLIRVAAAVQARSVRYAKQLKTCPARPNRILFRW